MTKKANSTDKLYQIKGWDEHFENNRTRNMKNMQWIPVANKHDGDGYTELVDRDNGAEMLGAWLAILQVASKCGERGTLMRDNGTPHTPKTISRLTRLKEGVICKALTLLCSPEIDWLQVVDSQRSAGGCGEVAPIAHPTDEEGKGRKEEKGREEKVKEASQIKLVMEHYNRVRGAMTQCQKMTSTRESQIRARISEVGFDELNKVIESCKDMPCLQGENDRGWTADLEWITKDSNFTKIREGKYIDNKPIAKPKWDGRLT